jgi:hypothetical protein
MYEGTINSVVVLWDPGWGGGFGSSYECEGDIFLEIDSELDTPISGTGFCYDSDTDTNYDVEITGYFDASDVPDEAPALGDISFTTDGSYTATTWNGVWARDELDGTFSGTIIDGGYWDSDAEYDGEFDVYRTD